MENSLIKECKGNLLKNVISRIDFDDLYYVDKDILKRIKKVCDGFELKLNMVRELESEEFELNDPIILRDMPNEYIKKSMCNSFFDEKLEFIVEVNQFFIRIIHKVDKNTYMQFEDKHLKILNEIIDIFKDENLTILRLSIKKIDEAYFKDINDMEKYFKSDLIQKNIFSKEQKWDIPSSGSVMSQNFDYSQRKINFYRRIDRVLVREAIEDNIKNNIFYKLYLDYEVYTRNFDDKSSIQEELIYLNKITRELFLESFTEFGKNKIIEGRSIGDYEDYNK